MIRAFICTWSSVIVSGSETITNPIHDFVDTLEPSATKADEITCSLYHPDADANGRPSKVSVLVLVTGPASIENLDSLAGVTMLPAHGFQKPIVQIPANERSNAQNRITANGIPLSALKDSAVYGDYLKNIAGYFIADFNSFGDHTEVARNLEFG